MSIELPEQESTILKYLDITHYIDTNAPEAQEKREAKYKIGEACKEARDIISDDEAFNEWLWTNIISECSATEIEEVTTNALVAWSKLPEFGTLVQCEIVGFTHISKLLQNKNADMKALVLETIANNDPETAKALIKTILKPTIDYTPIVEDKEKLASTVESVNKLSKEALVALVKAMHQEMIKP
ncbi:hypothetical protein [Psychromonas sp. SP041]|uniref:hypothetical protein n=1 Tax=Psychromonas sp. SP041 TaxID=1365007 RepID=UPI00041A0666|nr:hypothetical protein [Psychromonas sp. SP041]